jgi:WG repeat protein
MKKTCFTLLLLIFTGLLSPAVVYPQTDDLKWSRGPNRLYPVSKWDATPRVKRIGFIDKTGKLVIDYDRLPSSTAMVGEFHEGRAVIYLNRVGTPRFTGYDVGFIDETGNMVIPPRFQDARPFSEGLAYVNGTEFRGFIDLQGKPVIKTDGEARDFHEGLAAVSSEKGLWGYVDRSGKMVAEKQYGFADDFSEGLAGVVVGKKFGFINQNGEMVIPPRFTPRRGPYSWSPLVATSRFSEGLAPVTTDGEFDKPYKSYGYINRKGDFVIPPQFLTAQLFSEGLALVVKVESVKDVTKVGWIDKSGQWVVTEVQGYAPPDVFSRTFVNPSGDWRYSEGLVSFRVYPEGKTLHGYMDRKGHVVIEPRAFNIIGPFLGGIARVFVKGGEGSSDDYGYIDKTGQFVWRSK